MKQLTSAGKRHTGPACLILLHLCLIYSMRVPSYGEVDSPKATQPVAALTAFDDWASQYAKISNSELQQQWRKKGLALARVRRAALLELIRTDPQLALQAALASPLRQALPPELKSELETPISGTGDLLVIGLVQKLDGPPVEAVQRFVRINGQLFRAYTYGRCLTQKTKRNVPVRGIALDGVLALEEQPVANATPFEPGITEAIRRVLIIRVDFSDLPGDPGNGVYTASYIQNIMDGQIAPFFHRSSYGTAALVCTISPRSYRLPQRASFYAARDMGYELMADAQSAAQPDFALSTYDSIVVVFSCLRDLPGSQVTYGGASEIGGRHTWINGEFDFRVLVHELGHGYGLWHANLWQVNDGNPISNAGHNVEYGDDFDPMGANLANDIRTDYNPWFKSQLGWLRDAQIQVVTTSGTYRLSPFDSASATGTLALKIMKDSVRNYWIGYRRSFTNNASTQNGAYIIWGYNVNQGSDLLDATTPGSKVQDAALGIGATLSDPTIHLTICPIAQGGADPDSYLDVNINLGSSLPVVSQNPQDQLVAPGQTAVFAVQALGNPLPAIQWQRCGAGSSAWTNICDGPHYQGSAAATLAVSDASLSMNGGRMRCVISNSSGTATSGPPALLTVIESGFTTLAGLGEVHGTIDGIGNFARFSAPAGLVVDPGGNVFVTEPAQSTIRKITSGGAVTTVAGFPGTSDSADGSARDARFCSPNGIAMDRHGNLYVADTENQTIRRITKTGIVSTFAGLAGFTGSTDGSRNVARFCFPQGLAMDGRDNLYVSCLGSSTIRKISPQGEVSTLAGVAGETGSADGPGVTARFLCPNGITADRLGNIYVADQNNSTVRKITPGGMVTTLAGSAGITGSTDGSGDQARFNHPAGVAVDKRDNLYVADTGNATIRKIAPSGLVSTVAGLAGQSGSVEGPTLLCRFRSPTGVAVDDAGDIFVADTGNATVRKYTPSQLEPPQLQTLWSGPSFVLVWSSLWHGYSLESRLDLAPGAVWVPVPESWVNIDGMKYFTNDLHAESAVFRLQRQ